MSLKRTLKKCKKLIKEVITMQNSQMSSSEKRFGISSSTLHIIAMAFMFCDHLCMTLLGNAMWLHYIGRIAYPIFAFMLVEGFRHTGNLKKYFLRMVIFALISEVPFDLMCGGTWFFPTQQNVMFTFIISMLLMLLMEQPKKIKKAAGRYILFAVTALSALLIGFIVGTVTMVDYFGGGIVMVLCFYFFQGDRILSFEVKYKKKWTGLLVVWINRIAQAYLVWQICNEMIGGLCENITIFGKTYEVVVESFGILALIPIWLYNGQKGITSKPFKYCCYAFYPAHILLLVALQFLIYMN